MVDVEFGTLTFDGVNFIVLENPMVSDNGYVAQTSDMFQFKDKDSFDTACKMCATLNEYACSHNGDGLSMMAGEQCFENSDWFFAIVFKEKDSSRCYLFTFFNDAETALALVTRFWEFAYADEIAEHNREVKTQDATDAARHVYEAAIEHGCSEQDARAKASRVLDEQLKQ